MSILVLTRDPEASRSLCSALLRSGHEAAAHASSGDATTQLRLSPPLVLVADTAVHDHSSVIAELRLGAPWARVLLIGEASLCTEPELPLVAKPFDASELAALVARESELAALDRSRHDLRDRVAGLTLLVDECFEAIVGLSADGIVRSWNPGAASLYGYRADEIIGRSVEILDVHPGQSGASLDAAERSVREAERRHKNGGELFVLLSRSRLTRENPGGIELAEVSLDITERRELQRGLEHSERLAAIGRIAAGMAHEINNPLAVIRASAAYVAEMAARSSDIELSLCASDVEMAVDRIGSFVQHVCGFARRERPQMADAPLQTALDIALRMVRPRIKDRGVELSVEPCPRVNVPHDPPRLAQAALNLLSNAVDSAALGGKHVMMRVLVGETDVRLEVDDDGPGLTHDHAIKLFEPFATTKPFGQGTGLGLAITRQIASDHGGSVQLVPRPEGGARAILVLPRFTASIYCLLVIDGDPSVRRALASDLRREGFDVVTAGTFAEARQLLRERKIHVLLVDAGFADFPGADLVLALGNESPGSRRLLMSVDAAPTGSDDADSVLGKPWSRLELTETVRRLCLKGDRRTSQSPPGGS